MILITHILIALLSVAAATYIIFKPSKNSLYATYALIASTLVTGTFLVISSSAHVLQSCLTGLVYVSIVSVGVVAAHVKLSRSKVN
jgi:hypothetical protein